jgi:hypothetical protein
MREKEQASDRRIEKGAGLCEWTAKKEQGGEAKIRKRSKVNLPLSESNLFPHE